MVRLSFKAEEDVAQEKEFAKEGSYELKKKEKKIASQVTYLINLFSLYLCHEIFVDKFL